MVTNGRSCLDFARIGIGKMPPVGKNIKFYSYLLKPEITFSFSNFFSLSLALSLSLFSLTHTHSLSFILLNEHLNQMEK